MFNPFYPFTRELLDSFIVKGKRYFVRQTFPRGKNPLDNGVKGWFMLSHYDRMVTAQDHFGAIEYDPNRFLYTWDDYSHRIKLRVAASELEEFRVYSSVFKPDWEKQVHDRLQQQVRKYVAGLDWSPKQSEAVDTNFELQFGELYIRLKYGSREAKVKFEEIEKLS